MSECSSSIDVTLEISCLKCGSLDTEVRITGSWFPGSRAFYIRCRVCREENFLEGCNVESPDKSQLVCHSLDSYNTSFTKAETGNVMDKPLTPQAAMSEEYSEMSWSCSYSVPPMHSINIQRQMSCSSSANGNLNHDVGPERSLSLNDMAENSVDADTIDKHVQRLVYVLRSQPCEKCNNINWKSIEGVQSTLNCKSCNNLVGFDNSHNYFELLPFLEEGKYRVKQCLFDDCVNDDANMFTLQENRDGQPVVKCTVCGRLQETSGGGDCDKDDTENKQSKGACGIGQSCGRTEINDLNSLRRGDHIAWHQSLSYWHHAIVQEVGGHLLCVIHYNGPLSNKIKGVIMEEWIETNENYFRTNQLYRLNYNAKDCLPPEEVIQRARSRIGETKYHLLGNNCEHFASWCKTGRELSCQAEAFKDTVQRHSNNWSFANSIVTYTSGFLAKAVGRSHQVKTATKVGGKALNVGLNLTSAGNDVGKAAGQVALREVKHVASAMNYLEAGIILVLEVGAICRDVRRAHDQRVSGEITRNEFLRVTIKRTSEGIGCAIGAATVLALPLPAKWIGCTLATLIGQGAGALAGKKLADLVV